MLKKILSNQTCADCRICCAFDSDDIWEAPLVSSELKQYILKNYPIQDFVPYKNSWRLKMNKSENDLYYCPMLSDNGCILGDNKPFDCKIWPFRVMNYKDSLVLTVSPVCSSIFLKPLNELYEFVNNGFADKIFSEAKLNTDIIKEYIPNYPILAIR